MSRSSALQVAAPRVGGRRLGFALVMATAAAVLALMLWSWGTRSSSSTGPAGGATNPQTAASVPAQLPAPRQSGNGWSVAVGQGFNPAADIAMLAWDTNAPAIEFVNPQSGLVTARVSVAYNPRPVFRRSAGQLLVSDEILQPSPGSGGTEGAANAGTRLLIFDLRGGLTLQSEFPIPNRLRSNGYGQPLVLSRDESRLAYVEYRYVASGPGCPGQRDPAVCDYFRLVEVDLRAAPAILGAVDLPAGCYPGIAPAGDQGFAVLCRDNTVTVFGDDLTRRQQVSFAKLVGEGQAYNEPTTRPFKAGLAAGLVLTNGEVVGLTSDGFELRGEQRMRLLPANTWLTSLPISLGGDRYALPFNTERTAPGASGVAFVNLATARVERTVQFQTGAWPLPRPNGDLFLLRRGSLGLLPATATAATAEIRVGDVRDDAEVLIP